MKKYYYFLMAALCWAFSLHVAHAQEIMVKGKVTDMTDGTGIPGVSILEKGTSNGSLTDDAGNFSIKVHSGAILVFSFVGFTSQELAATDQSPMHVSLSPDTKTLDEVVVVGYGKQEKGDVTGVVAAVDSKSFNRGAIVSPDQLISGKIAGVQIMQNSGEPGGQSTVRIRGGTSLNAGNEPLYVIDGVPIDNSAFNPGGFSSGRNPLNFISPNDIETFTVLKDASAAAIYGSRAANGVIIITTKKGRSGAPKVEYTGWASVGKIAKQLEVFDAAGFRNIVAERGSKNVPLLGDASTNWQDHVYQTATGQNHAITVSGGSEKLTYRLSVGHQDQEGIVKTSSTKRTSFSLNMNQTLLDDDLTISANIKGSHTNDQFSPDVIGVALEMAPTQPIYDETSPFGGYYVWKDLNGIYVRQATNNPVSTINQTKDFGKTNRSIGNVTANYKIKAVPGLSANVNLGYDISDGARQRFQPSTLYNVIADTGEIRIENMSRVSRLLETYATYGKSFPGSKFDVTLGYSWQDWNSEYPSIRATKLTDNSYGYNNPSVAKKVEAFNSVLENRLISFFGRVNYSLKDRYLITATLRRDGSTRFAPSNRWGMFPSAAIAWRIMDENFGSALRTVFSDLKIRAGYGVNGNQEIGDFRYLPTYTPGTSTAQYQFGNSFISTLRPNGYDSNLKWEETTSYNIGIDYGILAGKISGSLEFYQKDTKDLLFERAVPPGSNLTNIVLSNIGEIRNTGVELTVNANALEKKDLSWNLSFNVSANRNRILALDGSDDPEFKGYETGLISGGVGNNVQILKVGKQVNSFYVYKHRRDSNGNPLVDGVDNNEDGVTNLADMYEDTNDDGVVDDEDRRPYKQASPLVSMGLTSQLSYKGFDLNFTLRSGIGNYVYNNIASNAANYSRANDNFVPRNMLTAVLKTNFANPQYFSDYYVESASFLRMDNITLGYNLTRLLNSKLNARIYGTVQNVFVINDYSGLDPEVTVNATSLTSSYIGIDNNTYPRARTFIVGINIGL